MRKILYIVCLVLLYSCDADYEVSYKKSGTSVRFSVVEDYGIQMELETEPKNDATYYYFSLLKKTDFDKVHPSDEAFMKSVLDSLKQDFEEWKKWKSGEMGEIYFGDFASHYFTLGPSKRIYTNLTPSTEYVAYAFCINPSKETFVGKLSYQVITTSAVSDEVSPMELDFRVILVDYGNTELSARPSVKGKSTNEPYIWGIFPAEEVDELNNGDLLAFLRNRLQEIGDPSWMVETDISTNTNARITFGKEYIICGAAYRTSWEKAVYTLHFTAERGLYISYTRDKADTP